MVFQYPWTSPSNDARCLTCGTVRGNPHSTICISVYKDVGVTLEGVRVDG